MGRFGNHNGRGRGRGHGDRQQNKEIPKKKKTLEDHYLYVGSSKQTSDFKTTYNFLINYIKRTYIRGNDIAEALRNMELQDTNNWKPNLQISTSQDANEKKREENQFELDYKVDYDEYMKRKRTLGENGYKT